MKGKITGATPLTERGEKVQASRAVPFVRPGAAVETQPVFPPLPGEERAGSHRASGAVRIWVVPRKARPSVPNGTAFFYARVRGDFRRWEESKRYNL